MPESNQYHLPDFIVVGANKGGTTSIYQYLKQHPQIFLSPVKEPHYFSKDIDPSSFSKEFAQNKLQDIEKYVNGDQSQEYHAAFFRNWEHYQKLFKNAGNAKATGELSTSYLFSKVAAGEIFNALGKIKIIICLRNPVDRAFSHYRMNLWTGNNNEFDFMKAIRQDEVHVPKVWGNAHLYVDLGFYYEQVKRYIDLFGIENVKIIFTEEMKKDTSKVIRELYQFIGVDASFEADTSKSYNEVHTPKFKNLTWLLNKSGIRPIVKKLSPKFIKQAIVKLLYKNKSDKGEIPADAKSYLLNVYRDDTMKLSSLLNKDLSNWMK